MAQPRPKYAPRPGSAAAIVFENLSKPISEIVSAAKAAGLDMDPKTAATVRSQVKYRIKNNYSPRRRRKSSKAKPKPAAKRKQRKASAPPAPPSSERSERQLRKIIFEVGYLRAREIFDEFAAMHVKLTGD